jgi:hypothetical protein
MIAPELRLAWAGAGDQVQVERRIKKARESGQQWGRKKRVYENGRRPAGVRPTNGDDGCKSSKTGRLDKGCRCVASSRAMGGENGKDVQG